MRFWTPALLLSLLCFGRPAAETAIGIGRVEVDTPGQIVEIAIISETPAPGLQMGGFDLYLMYDSALTLLSADMGPLLTDCQWEFFNTGEGLGGGLHLAAMADVSNGPYHPLCFGDTSDTLAVLSFAVDPGISSGCGYLPVYWIWYDCTDNTVSTVQGDSLLLSRHVYDFDGRVEFLLPRDVGFPTGGGAPESCLPDLRLLDFHNGGVAYIFNDNAPPTALCPDDTTVTNDPGSCGATVYFEPTAFDDCFETTVICSPASGSFFSFGTSHVLCLAEDISGNTDTCGFDITVYDTTAPVITCPGDIIATADSGRCGSYVWFEPEMTDNCPGSFYVCSPLPGAFFDIGTTPVTCIAVDTAGRTDTCSFNVLVFDTQSPTVSCPDTVFAPADSGQCGAAVHFVPTVDDNCPGATVTVTPPPGTFYEVGSTPAQYTAIDAYGKTVYGSFVVAVRDTQAPIIARPRDTTVACDSGLCGATVLYNVAAEDNCSDITLVCDPPPGTFFDIGDTEITCLASDAAGNTDTARFVITVIDTQPPLPWCPADTIVVNDPGQCGAVVDFLVFAVDNCPGATAAAHPPPKTTFPIGVTAVTTVALDAAGNTDSCRFTITVVDSEPPRLTCPADISVYNDSGSYAAVVEFTPVVSDNCPGWTLAADPPSESDFEIGTTQVTVAVSDRDGLADTCRFSVTVTLNDPDNDGLPDWDDNCPDTYNPDQTDTDGNNIGDACDWQYGDANHDMVVNVGDIVFVIAYIFKGGAAPRPLDAGDANCDHIINVGDAVYLVNYVFTLGPPPGCP